VNGYTLVFLTKTEFKCNDGYERKGVREFHCRPNGHYDYNINTDRPTCVPRTCDPTPAPKHGKVYRTNDGQYPSIASFSCDRGYRLVGAPTATCNTKGHFDHPTPTCVKIECTNLPSVKNGVVSWTKTKFPQEAHVECDNGYELLEADTNTVRCSGAGKWVNLPRCIGIKCAPLTIFNARIKLTNRGRYPSTVAYSCENGFKRTTPEAFAECGTNGIWSPHPGCAPVQCAPLNITNGVLQISNGGKFPSKATAVCDEGFEQENKRDGECLPDGTWARPPRCIGKRCYHINHPPHGQVAVTNSGRYPAKAIYSCDAGYALQQTPSRAICQWDGKWIGDSPVCLPAMCQPPLAPKHGHITLSSLDSSLATFTCNPGFELHGFNTSFCSEDVISKQTAWSSPVPVCHRIVSKTAPRRVRISAPKIAPWKVVKKPKPHGVWRREGFKTANKEETAARRKYNKMKLAKRRAERKEARRIAKIKKARKEARAKAALKAKAKEVKAKKAAAKKAIKAMKAKLRAAKGKKAQAKLAKKIAKQKAKLRKLKAKQEALKEKKRAIEAQKREEIAEKKRKQLAREKAQRIKMKERRLKAKIKKEKDAVKREALIKHKKELAKKRREMHKTLLKMKEERKKKSLGARESKLWHMKQKAKKLAAKKAALEAKIKAAHDPKQKARLAKKLARVARKAEALAEKKAVLRAKVSSMKKKMEERRLARAEARKARAAQRKVLAAESSKLNKGLKKMTGKLAKLEAKASALSGKALKLGFKQSKLIEAKKALSAQVTALRDKLKARDITKAARKQLHKDLDRLKASRKKVLAAFSQIASKLKAVHAKQASVAQKQSVLESHVRDINAKRVSVANAMVGKKAKADHHKSLIEEAPRAFFEETPIQGDKPVVVDESEFAKLFQTTQAARYTDEKSAQKYVHSPASVTYPQQMGNGPVVTPGAAATVNAQPRALVEQEPLQAQSEAPLPRKGPIHVHLTIPL